MLVSKPVELEMTLEPKPVLMVVVIATAPLAASTTDKCEVPWSSGFIACLYCPPYTLYFWVALSEMLFLYRSQRT